MRAIVAAALGLRLFGTLCPTAWGAANKATAMIDCTGLDEGAMVSLDGKIKGECPIELQIIPGSHQIHVVKTVKGSADQVYDQTIQLDAGATQSIRPRFVVAAQSFATIDDLAKAADQGNAYAMFLMGYRVMTGQGVQQDYGAAVTWYQKAAAGNNVDAMTGLGFAYEYGRGYVVNDAKAREWYLKAASLGNLQAMTYLGRLYRNGHCGAPDYAQANLWFKKAADSGYASAVFELAQAYEFGYGVRQDQSTAMTLYNKAADKGNDSARQRLSAIRQEQIAAAARKQAAEEAAQNASNDDSEDMADNDSSSSGSDSEAAFFSGFAELMMQSSQNLQRLGMANHGAMAKRFVDQTVNRARPPSNATPRPASAPPRAQPVYQAPAQRQAQSSQPAAKPLAPVQSFKPPTIPPVTSSQTSYQAQASAPVQFPQNNSATAPDKKYLCNTQNVGINEPFHLSSGYYTPEQTCARASAKVPALIAGYTSRMGGGGVPIYTYKSTDACKVNQQQQDVWISVHFTYWQSAPCDTPTTGVSK